MRGNRQTDKTDKLDRVLLAQDTLLPSSGFTASVMEAIQQQALPSAPIPFPWRLALPGIAALLVGFAVLGWFAVSALRNLDQNLVLMPDWLTWMSSNSETSVLLRTQAAPALLAIAAALGCVLLCRKLAGEWSTR
jgi:uncharacterized protein involved in cysteine biosynthesis